MRSKSSLLAASLVIAIGCSPSVRTPSPSAVVTPPPQEQTSPADNPGSLYNPDGANMLFADSRARKVGDILLVKVVESTLAKNKATTSTSKDGSTDLGVSAFLGKDEVPLIPGAVGSTSLLKTSSVSKFGGAGETKNESSFVTSVAVRVTRVLGGGLMEVAGARETRVNGENQIVQVQGLVRDRDINADNTVKSTSLADARIELYGEGLVSEKQRPGWLGRVIENVWPF